MSDVAIKFENVSKLYELGTVGTGTLSHDLKRWWITSVLHKEDPYLKIGETNDRSTKGDSKFVYALKDIDFEVKQGDVLGIIGKNGAGKSTLLKLLSRVTAPTTGKIYTKGRIASLLEVGTGFHPELTGRENIYMNGTIMGMKKWEIDRKLDEIVDFSGCERYLDTPVKRYSSGMMVRLGFAVAAHLEPEILVVDEVLAVGDAEFQKKAIGKMQDVSKGEGRTVLFVSHNMASIKSLCNTGVLLKYGMVDYMGEMNSVIERYLSTQKNRSNKIISEIQERVGSGKLKFTNVEFLDYKGDCRNSFVTGEVMRIKIYFENYGKIKEYNNARIDVGINNMLDYQLLWMSSYMFADTFDSSNGYILFTIHSIPLSGGIYNINLYSMIDGEVADWIQNVTSFVVEFHDYYGTGRILPQNQVPFIIDYKVQ